MVVDYAPTAGTFHLVDELFSGEVQPIKFSLDRYKSAFKLYCSNFANIGICATILYACNMLMTAVAVFFASVSTVLLVTIILSPIGLLGWICVISHFLVVIPTFYMNYLEGVVNTMKVKRQHPLSMMLIPQRRDIFRRLIMFYAITIIHLPAMAIALLMLLIPVVGGVLCIAIVCAIVVSTTMLTAPSILLLSSSYLNITECLKTTFTMVRMNFLAMACHAVVDALIVAGIFLSGYLLRELLSFVPYVGFLLGLIVILTAVTLTPFPLVTDIVTAAEALGLGTRADPRMQPQDTPYDVEPSAPDIYQ